MKKGYFLHIPFAIIAGIAVCIGAIFGILAIIFGMLKANPAYRMGMEMAKNDPAVNALLGSPIKDGFFVGGSVMSSEYCCATANLETSISGPKAHGTFSIYGLAHEDGSWTLEDATIRIGGKIALTYSSAEAAQGFHKPLR